MVPNIMSTNESSVRAHKSALIKLGVLKSTLELVKDQHFEDIHVSQICSKTEISKVTLFKYFPQKEDILLYFQRIWCFRRNVELSIQPKKGIEGLKYLFEKTGESYTKNPGMFLGLISYLSKLDMPVKPYPVKSEEKKLLYPEMDGVSCIQIVSLEQLFEQYLLDAVLANNINRTSNISHLKNMLVSVYYGTIFSAHLKQSEYPIMEFKNAIKFFETGYSDSSVMRPAAVFN